MTPAERATASSAQSGRADRSAPSPAGAAATAQPTATAQPATAARARNGVDAVPRRVRLTLARVDPWSVTKLSFLLSVAVGIALVVATAVVWSVLDGMGVFTDLDGLLTDVVGNEVDFDLLDYVGFGKVISLATVIAVVDVVLLTALSTIVAFLYNVSSALVGGLHVTLSDD
ncbi:hypothetical protein FHR75_002157 [Kineococcus radiotolerans]|uniref:DUF3566 domain-containing protein n=2 Tax=Kineococcus radiotolerans TaxID=131568 RepID=A6W3W1_KINRD|nr:DUF3566 domain-containing protein [Kineococcus radiotolerans]ABS01500.1 conserved hypothetical protein [Kineococcus radiotolerans SRS30216 = ATCC BAA-149]MBB2901369.1 hypothetical protein [Kineococcus radiotolerans]